MGIEIGKKEVETALLRTSGASANRDGKIALVNDTSPVTDG